MQSLEDLLKSKPGIDYAGTMKRMSDNTVFYTELLRLFFKDNAPERLERALNSKDYQNAIYEAHGLKGTAANLGLLEISKTCAQIHVHLKNNEIEESKLLLNELKQAYLAISDLADQI